MDNWLSQTFTPLLQQYVANYSKEQVKVSFLKGKGVMRHVVLNVEELNALPAVAESPLRFARVACDQVGFKASLTRIKTQPVTVYIEHMDIDIYEQPPISSSASSRRLATTSTPLMSSSQHDHTTTLAPPSPPSPTAPRPYKLQQRILDGLRVEIKEVRLCLRTLGRRKCAKVGEWSPPDGLWVLRDLTFLSVDESGLEGNLEECWKFNKTRMAAHKHKKDFFLFKQLRVGSLSFFLLPRSNSTTSSPPPLLLVEETPFTCDFTVRRLLHDVNVVLGLEVDLRVDRFRMCLGQKNQSYQNWLAFFTGFYSCLARRRSTLTTPGPPKQRRKGSGGDDDALSVSAASVNTTASGLRGSAMMRRNSDGELMGCFGVAPPGSGARMSVDYEEEEEEEEEMEEDDNSWLEEEDGGSIILPSEEILEGEGGEGSREANAVAAATATSTSTPQPRLALVLSMDLVEIKILNDNETVIPEVENKKEREAQKKKDSGWLFAFYNWRTENIRTETAGTQENLLQFYLGHFDLRALDSKGDSAHPDIPALLRPMLATQGGQEADGGGAFPALVPRGVREADEEEGDDSWEGGPSHLLIPDTLTLKMHAFVYPPPPPPQLAGTLEVKVGRRLQVVADLPAWQHLLAFFKTHTDTRCLSGQWGADLDYFPLQNMPGPGVRDVHFQALGAVVHLPPGAMAKDAAAFTLTCGASSLRISTSLHPASFLKGLMDPRLRVENPSKEVVKKKHRSPRASTTPRTLTPSLSAVASLAPWRMAVSVAELSISTPLGSGRRGQQELNLLAPTPVQLHISVEDSPESPRARLPENMWYVPLDELAFVVISLAFPEPLCLHLHPQVCQALICTFLPPLTPPPLSPRPWLARFAPTFTALLTCANVRIVLPSTDKPDKSNALLLLAVEHLQIGATKTSISGLVQQMRVAAGGLPLLELGGHGEGHGVLARCDEQTAALDLLDEVRLLLPLEEGQLDVLAETLHACWLSWPPSLAAVARLPSTREWAVRSGKTMSLLVSLGSNLALRTELLHMHLTGKPVEASKMEWSVDAGLCVASRLGDGAVWQDVVPETEGSLILLAGADEQILNNGWKADLTWSSATPQNLQAHLSTELAIMLQAMKERVAALLRRVTPPGFPLSVAAPTPSTAALEQAQNALATRLTALGHDARRQGRHAQLALTQAKEDVQGLAHSYQEQLVALQRTVAEKELQRQVALSLHHADYSCFMRVGYLASSFRSGSSVGSGGKKALVKGVKAKVLVTLPKVWCVLKKDLLLCYDQPHSFHIQRVLALRDLSSTLQPFVPSDLPSSRFYNRVYALSFTPKKGEEPLILVSEVEADMAIWKKALHPYLTPAINEPSTPSKTNKRSLLTYRHSPEPPASSSGSKITATSPKAATIKTTPAFSLKAFGLRGSNSKPGTKQQQQQTATITTVPEPIAANSQPAAPQEEERELSLSLSSLSSCSNLMTMMTSPQQAAAGLRHLVVNVEAVATSTTDDKPAVTVALYSLSSTILASTAARTGGQSWTITHTWPEMLAFHSQYIQLWTTALENAHDEASAGGSAHPGTGLTPLEALSYANQLLLGAQRLLELPFPSEFERNEQAALLERYWRLLAGTSPPDRPCLLLLQRFLGVPTPYSAGWDTTHVGLPPSMPPTDTTAAAHTMMTTLQHLESQFLGLNALVTSSQVTTALHNSLFAEYRHATQQETKALAQQVQQLQQALEEKEQRTGKLEQELTQAHLAREDAVLAMTEVSTDAARKLMEAELRYTSLLKKTHHHHTHHAHHHVQSHHHTHVMTKARSLSATPPPPLEADGGSMARSMNGRTTPQPHQRRPSFGLTVSVSSQHHESVKPVTTPRQRREQLEELLRSSSSMGYTTEKGGGGGGGEEGVGQAQHYEVIFRLKSLLVAREEEARSLREELAMSQEELGMYQRRVRRWREMDGQEGEEEDDGVLSLWKERVMKAEARQRAAETELAASQEQWRRLLLQVQEEGEEAEKKEEGDEVAWGRMRAEYCTLLEMIKERI